MGLLFGSFFSSTTQETAVVADTFGAKAIAAAKAGNKDVLEGLSSSGSLQAVRAEHGKTLLHLAARAGDAGVQAVNYLISIGLDVHAVDDNGMRPVYEATLGSSQKGVDAIVKAASCHGLDQVSSGSYKIMMESLTKDMQERSGSRER